MNIIQLINRIRRQLKSGTPAALGIFILSFSLSILFFQISYADNSETSEAIRVGYYPLENFHFSDDGGTVTGYEADYLKRITDITGQKFEYVKAASWSDAAAMLRSGQVDMISPALITADRLSEFAFSVRPLGRIYGAVLTGKDSSIIYEDFDAFSEMTFGVEDGSVYYSLFQEYAAKNGFTPAVRIYADYEEVKDGLNSGEIDAAAVSIMRADDSTRLLGRFGVASYYFMMRKDDTHLLDFINSAMDQLNLTMPELEDDLLSQYFPVYNEKPLTKAETEFVNHIGPLTIGCVANIDPVCYLDETTGEVSGITRDILDLVAENCGLTFTYRALAGGSITYDDLRNSGIDLIAGVEYNGINAASSGLSLTNPYLKAEKVLAGLPGREFNPEAPLIIAVTSGSQTLDLVIKNKYPLFTVIHFDTVDECLDAVRRGKADFTLQNQYSVDHLLSRPIYEQFAIIAKAGIGDSHSLSPVLHKMKAGDNDPVLSDPMLISVLNKGIDSLSDEEISFIVINQTISRHYRYTVWDFLYRYRASLTIAGAALCALLFLFYYAVMMRRKNLQLLVESERNLENLTNNINGGVLILNPEGDLPIFYSNTGFWNLLKQPADEITSLAQNGYMNLVHSDDRADLKNMILQLTPDNNQISLRLRICRSDGTFVPVLFNGTSSCIADGHMLLFCVIMNISRELAIQNRLLLEEQKHSFLIEKTEEILYEVDFEEKSLRTSDTFYKKFGWTPAGSFTELTADLLLKNWNIFEEDRASLKAVFHESLSDRRDSQAVVRFLLQDGSCLWCMVRQFFMLDQEGNPHLLLGQIIDVDAEIREKQSLKEKSQKDTATNLLNKEAFRQQCSFLMKERAAQRSALVFIDLDNFKAVNDTLGHLTGDRVISDVAEKLVSIFAPEDIISRFGGDEFCVFIRDISVEGLQIRMEQLLRSIRTSYSSGNVSVPVTASVGIAWAANSGHSFDILMKHADTALYQSKDRGKNRYFIFNDHLSTL